MIKIKNLIQLNFIIFYFIRVALELELFNIIYSFCDIPTIKFKLKKN